MLKMFVVESHSCVYKAGRGDIIRISPFAQESSTGIRPGLDFCPASLDSDSAEYIRRVRRGHPTFSMNAKKGGSKRFDMRNVEDFA
jgi:hypothetical protein